MYATDANTLIFYFKGNGNIARRLQSIPPRDFAIPALVLYELEVGTGESTKRREILNAFTQVCRVLPFDESVAKRAAAIRKDLEKRGERIGPLDILIAATAISNGLTLITHNTDEFSRVYGLLFEDWF